jgi:hypothetical protein
MANRKPLDWEAIEREYRAGQLSVVEIAAQHSVSRAAIQKRAKKNKWSRDLREKIKERVAAKLVAPEVAAATEAETVELAAARGVQIVREHRDSIGRAQRIVEKLFGELELSEIALPAKSTVIGNLSNSLKTLIGLERQAFNLNEGDGGNDGGPVKLVVEWLKQGE